MKAKANNLSGFSFTRAGSGCYLVTYQNRRGDYYKAYINNMSVIDATLHANWAKAKDIQHLYYLVKNFGTHYNSKGKRL